jgi:hypothetical protein
MLFNETSLANGTAFVVEREDRKFLITNWHNLSGRHPETNSCISATLAVPNKVRVAFHVSSALGRLWQVVEYELLDTEGNRRWKERRLEDGRMIDVAALEIVIPEGAAAYPVDLALKDTDLVVTPSEPVCIVGYPNKLNVMGLPIWKIGHVASDIEIDYTGKPIFLIDTATKSGMSGSPVIKKSVGSHSVAGGLAIGGTRVKFMGVYSGRINDGDTLDGSNLGLVWKPETIDLILAS